MPGLPVDFSFPQTEPFVRVARHQLLLLGVGVVGTLLWGWFLVVGQPVAAANTYLVLLGLYGVASAAFLWFRMEKSQLNVFDLPVFMTILIFAEFGVAPLESFVNPARLDSALAGQSEYLVTALAVLMAGVVAFWLGCITATRKRRDRQGCAAESGHVRRAVGQLRILRWLLLLYAISIAVRVYLLTHHLYSYLGSDVLYWHNLALMQVLMAFSTFGTYALIIAGIEKYLRPYSRPWDCLFWAIFLSECWWGLISGMKGLVLQNFLIGALVSSLTQRKCNRAWITMAVAGAILLYPVSNEYRNLVRTEHQEVTTFTSAIATQALAVSRTNDETAGVVTELLSGFRDTVSRLDLLQSVGMIVALGPRARDLLGGERWWMLPFYPFIPRFFWPTKPALVEGARFSVMLGFGPIHSTAKTIGTSTAVTYPGDLYVRGGLFGVLLGMFCLGLVAQWLTNTVLGPLERRSLFVYVALFLTVTSVEADAFSFWSGLIKAFVILTSLGWLVYGTTRDPLSPTVPTRRALSRT